MQLNVIVRVKWIQNMGSSNFCRKKDWTFSGQIFYFFFDLLFDLDFALAFAMKSLSLHGY
ncbi:MAG: hypothetical protein D4R72_07175 [Nitrosopumilales archaeon]|nr:MAG: hypothetical protein D4R72_07175 [Nitrosopumilales archaeon]